MANERCDFDDLVVGGQWVKTLTEEDETGALTDFTGFDVQMTIRTDNAPNGEEVYTLAVGTGEITISTTTITLTLTADQTEELLDGTYVYDLWVIPSANTAQRYLYGNFVINPRVTIV